MAQISVIIPLTQVTFSRFSAAAKSGFAWGQKKGYQESPSQVCRRQDTCFNTPKMEMKELIEEVV